jgi:two-component system, NarL family, sensor kinase
MTVDRPILAPLAAAAPTHGRGPWLALGGLWIAVALAFLGVQLATPFDGARVPPGREGFTAEGLRVAPFGRSDHGLRDGDVVVAIDGRGWESWVGALFGGAAPRPTLRRGDSVRYTVLRADERLEVEVVLTGYPLAAALRANWGTIVFALLYLTVAGLVFARRPSVAATRPFFLSACALLAATVWSLGLRVSDVTGATGFWLYQAGAGLGFMLFWSAGLHFALSFPRPLPWLQRAWLPWLLYGLPALLLARHLLLGHREHGTTSAWIATWSNGVDLHAAIVLSLTIVVFALQYALRTDPVERQQMRWGVFAAVVAGSAGLLLYLLPPLLGLPAVHPNLIGLVVSVFPLSIAVAVMRHNLFDIDRLLGHALVYGVLSAGVLTVYVGVVFGLGRTVGSATDPWWALLATAIVAVGFQPLRVRWQRVVDRRLFGERSEPLRLLARLGTQLEATAEPGELLPNLVATVSEALRLPYVAVTLEEDGRETLAAEYGRRVSTDLTLPLVDAGTVVGYLRVAPRDPGTLLPPADRELLATIARQAGVALRQERLTRDLRRSRAQLVALREEERRRLRRDLHDGLGPTLGAMAMKLDAARNLLHPAPDRAEALLHDLRAQLHDAVADVRRVVHGLRPPALDELGLLEALRAHAQQLDLHGPRVEVEAPVALPSLPAAVEVAAYRIVQEALTNVLRHAHATRCRVTLTVGAGVLEVVVDDDGRGIAPGAPWGVGVTSMRERAAELGGEAAVAARPGGGTRVQARLPLPKGVP